MRHEEQIRVLKELQDLHNRQVHKEMAGEPIHLDVDRYFRDDVFEAELNTVFNDYPLVVGHVSQVPDVGDYFLCDWNRLPIVVIRGRDGRVRAFYNICRHRGARLTEAESGTLKLFVCPYHGWSYELDGSLRKITRKGCFPGVDTQEHNLVELPTEVDFGLIWVHPVAGESFSPRQYLGPYADDLDSFGIADLVSYKKSRVVKKANWKLLIKTYLEGYHVPFLHKDTLSAAFRRAVLSFDEHGRHIRLAAARTDFEKIKDIAEDEWEILEHASVYYSLFPNCFFIMHPDYVSLSLFWPLSPDETLWTHDMLYKPGQFDGEHGQRGLEKRFRFTNDVVFDQEDFAVSEGIQAGLRTGVNRTHVLGLEEGLLARFQNNIDSALHGEADPPSAWTPA